MRAIGERLGCIPRAVALLVVEADRVLVVVRGTPIEPRGSAPSGFLAREMAILTADDGVRIVFGLDRAGTPPASLHVPADPTGSLEPALAAASDALVRSAEAFDRWSGPS